MGKYNRRKRVSPWYILLTILLAIPAGWLTANFLGWGVLHVGVPGSTSQAEPMQLGALDRFDMQMTNKLSSALEGVLSIEKVYWLNDHDQIAPEPDQDKFGTTSDPATMQGFLDEAKELLGVEDTLFSTETKLYSGRVRLQRPCPLYSKTSLFPPNDDLLSKFA